MKRMAMLSGAAALGALAAPATAMTMKLTIDIDNDVHTFSSSSGSLVVSGVTLDGVTIDGSFSLASTKPDSLTISTANIVNTNATPVSYEAVLSATDFAAPVKSIIWSGGGSWISSATTTYAFNYYSDPLNKLQTTSTPPASAVTIGGFHGTVSGLADSFGQPSTTSAFGATGPFSMTEEWDGELIAGARLVSRGQVMVANVIPEPTTWALLGIGFAMLGGVGWKKSRKDAFVD